MARVFTDGEFKQDFDPMAPDFTPGCKPGGTWGANWRKDDPSGDGGGGFGAPEQVSSN